MFLKKLTLRSFRNYRDLSLDLSPGVNLFYGENAQGKTNLLEAVYFLGGLRSFRGAKTAQVISWNEKEGVVSGESVTVARNVGGYIGWMGPNVWKEPAGRVRRLEVTFTKDAKKAFIDGKRPASVREYLLALKVTSFSAEDLFLVKEYPSCRRRFLDRSIFHVYPAYLGVAGRYRAALRQLSAAMKSGDEAVVVSWEDVLAPLAAEVTMKRRERAEQLEPAAAALFGKVLGGGKLGLVYKTSARGGGLEELEASWRSQMEKRRAEGMRRGHCLVGPHTDDVVVTLSGRDMRTTASRGQSRLSLLALVLADGGLYKTERGEDPVLLLDDPASELDDKRRGALMEYISGLGQVLIASTDAGLMGGKGVRYRVTTDSDGFGSVAED